MPDIFESTLATVLHGSDHREAPLPVLSPEELATCSDVTIPLRRFWVDRGVPDGKRLPDAYLLTRAARAHLERHARRADTIADVRDLSWLINVRLLGLERDTRRDRDRLRDMRRRYDVVEATDADHRVLLVVHHFDPSQPF